MAGRETVTPNQEPLLLAGTAVFVLLCWLTPPIYLMVLWQAKLKTLPAGGPMHLSSVPWTEPMVAILTGLSTLTLAGVFVLGQACLGLVRRRSIQGKTGSGVFILTGAIFGASLLETIAIYGLVLSFALQNRNVLLLTLIMMAAAPIGHLALWPWPSRWKRALAGGATP